MTNESIVVVSTAAVTLITLFIKSYFDDQRFLRLRQQDRLDRESEARIRLADKIEILAAGDTRKDEIIKETKQVKTVAVKSMLKSEQAINAANNITEKFHDTVEVAKRALEKVESLPPKF